MTRVAILGAGFGGLGVARALARRRRRFEITIVDRTNSMIFTPMLPEVASGSVEPRHVAQPVRAALDGKATFVLGDVESVDFDSRRVRVAHPVTHERSELAYDQLVIALGAENSTHGVPGAGSHTLPLKTINDAMAVRRKVVAALEAATVSSGDEREALLTFAVAGGGFTGVEAAGELLGYIRGVTREYPQARDARVVLLAGTHRLLEQLPPRFGKRARSMLARRGVEIIFDDRVAAVDAGGVTLSSGSRIGCSTVIWSAGVRVPPVVAELDLPHSEHHGVSVEADCSVKRRPGVWALGDCAQIPKTGGGWYPQTAQDAVAQAPLVAENIRLSAGGKRTRPFRYHSRGMMASLGHREGLAEIGLVMLSGFPAWLLWRAYYWTRLPGVAQKTRVALDWTLALSFPFQITSVE